MRSLLKEIRQYYDFWHRWSLLLILGLGFGAWVGSVLYFQLDQPADFKVTAEFNMPKLNLHFKVVSPPKRHDKEAVQWIVEIATKLEVRTGGPVEIDNLEMERRNDSPLWKWTVLGGIFGALLVIGGIILWEYARNQYRHQQQKGVTTSPAS